MKKWKLVLLIGVMVLACIGCGAEKTPEGGEAGAPEEEVSADETEADTEDVQAEEETANEPAENEVEEKNDNNSDLEAKGDSGEVTAFAEKIQAAVVDKDMEALADLCSYPLAVNGEVVEEKAAFMELGADVIFTEERCAAIAAVDTSALEETMAGVVMGEATPNIIFGSVDGELGITGIN